MHQTQTPEDVWESEDEECFLNSKHSKRSRVSTTVANRDWNKIESNIEKDGYRQGLESTQEEALQDGFNAAFMQSFKMSMAAGRLQGEICARLQCSSVPSSMKSGEKLASHHFSEQNQILNDINERISSLITNIPKQLQQKSYKGKECCEKTSESDVCDSSAGQTDSDQERAEGKEKDCSTCDAGASIQDTEDFWNELEKHESNLKLCP